MKRTLTISLYLALGAIAVAQNPVVMQQNAKTAVTVAQSAGKPAPGSVKVVPVPARKPAAASKPVVVAAKPAVAHVKPVAVSAKPAVVAVKEKTVSAKPVAVSAKPAVVSAKPAVVAIHAAPAKAPTQAKPEVVASKPVAVPVAHNALAKQAHKGLVKAAPVVVKVSGPHPHPAAKAEAGKPRKKEAVAVEVGPAVKLPNSEQAEGTRPQAPAQEPVAQNGRRDPFVSPIVSVSSIGSGCSSGKRCLAIDQVNLKGIVKSENGMIAVVVNAAEKAYFLRENDPVFNGYVEKITGDSIVFKETFHDRLGKPLTRDVTKTISRPVA